MHGTPTRRVLSKGHHHNLAVRIGGKAAEPRVIRASGAVLGRSGFAGRGRNARTIEAGTGVGLNGPGIPLAAGKTGTAEDSTGGPDHAWFGCYAPYPDGKIVVVAFAQNTPGGGSVHALPMAKKVLAEWERTRQR